MARGAGSSSFTSALCLLSAVVCRLPNDEAENLSRSVCRMLSALTDESISETTSGSDKRSLLYNIIKHIDSVTHHCLEIRPVSLCREVSRAYDPQQQLRNLTKER
jgi:hypothetical protein